MHSRFYPLQLTLLSLIALSMTGCPDATETAKACAKEISELQNVCPAGTSAVLRAEASGSCEGSGSADFLSESGELSGSCKSAGSCEFVCMIQPDRCECGVESFTNDEVVCKACAACGDGRCSDDETPESCPRDCAAMCEAGAVRCSGDGRQQCSEQGSWDSLPCPEGETCRDDNGTVICGMTCVEGTTRCNGENRQQCSLQGVWETLACPEGERCVEGMDGSAACMGVCESGVYRCNGDAREQCNALGQWEVLACPEGERCVEDGDVVTCRAGCERGAFRCNGNAREQCSLQDQWEALRPAKSNSFPQMAAPC